MIDLKVSIVPLIAIAAINFFVSWIYYSPVAPWFKAWQRAVGMDTNKKEMTPEEKKQLPGLMIGAFLASFLLSYGLQVIVHSLKISSFITGMAVGIVVWFTFALTHSLNTRFEGRKPSLLAINNGLYIVTYSLFAGIIAVWQ
jgi:hypothetical protein